MDNFVHSSDKVELEVYHLAKLIEKAILDTLERTEAGESVDALEAATDFAMCYAAENRKEQQQ